MSQAHAASVGGPLCVTSAYRTYSEQAAVYRSKPGLAAVPGKSEHGWGKAVDLCGGVEDSGSSAHRWMQANAGRFGWFHPDWAEPGGSRPEPWHWEYGG
jgi:LAS superfamily LD-carboxypeptidase LdcB